LLIVLTDVPLFPLVDYFCDILGLQPGRKIVLRCAEHLPLSCLQKVLVKRIPIEKLQAEPLRELVDTTIVNLISRNKPDHLQYLFSRRKHLSILSISVYFAYFIIVIPRLAQFR
jgi:hypothetical protein